MIENSKPREPTIYERLRNIEKMFRDYKRVTDARLDSIETKIELICDEQPQKTTNKLMVYRLNHIVDRVNKSLGLKYVMLKETPMSYGVGIIRLLIEMGVISSDGLKNYNSYSLTEKGEGWKNIFISSNSRWFEEVSSGVYNLYYVNGIYTLRPDGKSVLNHGTIIVGSDSLIEEIVKYCRKRILDGLGGCEE